MNKPVIIYGTEGCPFCIKAREDYGDRAIFYNVQTDSERLQEMLVLSRGDKSVPVIVEGDTVTVGYGGA